MNKFDKLCESIFNKKEKINFIRDNKTLVKTLKQHEYITIHRGKSKTTDQYAEIEWVKSFAIRVEVNPGELDRFYRELRYDDFTRDTQGFYVDNKNNLHLNE